MHNIFLPSDIMAALALVAGVYSLKVASKQAKAQNRRLLRSQKMAGYSLLAYSAANLIIFRLIHDIAVANLASFCIFFPLIVTSLLVSTSKHELWIKSELAAGRVPKEIRVYNDWAKPDPEQDN